MVREQVTETGDYFEAKAELCEAMAAFERTSIAEEKNYRLLKQAMAKFSWLVDKVHEPIDVEYKEYPE